MSFKLLVNPPVDDRKELELKTGITIFGRDESADITIPDGHISRKHMQLELQGNELFLTDLGSTNGTMVNDQKVEKIKLHPGDCITLGAFTLKVADENAGTAEAAAAPAPAVAELVDDGKEKGVSVLKEIRASSSFKFRDSVKMQAEAENIDKVSLENVTSDSVVSENLVESVEKADKEKIEIIQKRLTLLYEIGRVLTSELDIDKLLDLLLEMLFGILPIEHGFIMLMDKKTKELVPRLARQRGGGEAKFSVSRTITRQAINKKCAILTSDAMSDSRFAAGASIAAFKIRSAMCCPIIIKDNIEGIIYVDNSKISDSFSEDDLAFLTAISTQAAVALENATLFKNIEEATRMRNNLQRYLSPSVVNDIIDNNKTPTVGGEKKEVSILFADIRNFTKLTTLVKPMELCEQLNEYFNEMTKMIFKYEGTLDKFIGDEVMAVFGAPFPHNDDVDRAIFTAIDMCNALHDLTSKWNVLNKKPFEFGIGIASGSVICGNFGAEERLDYTCVGDTVNIAKRLTEAAHPNQILIEQKTFERNHGGFKTNKILPIRMKGKTEAIKVYEVLH